MINNTNNIIFEHLVRLEELETTIMNINSSINEKNHFKEESQKIFKILECNTMQMIIYDRIIDELNKIIHTDKSFSENFYETTQILFKMKKKIEERLENLNKTEFAINSKKRNELIQGDLREPVYKIIHELILIISSKLNYDPRLINKNNEIQTNYRQ